ncbi:hypothetical protein FSP39_007220 [Pinctada imbricata]|uniref:Brain tumor protein n=1 Tax=Pinctada imbricata TaxID=66713 RepID=A0AA88Y7M1_PINIB|nr:hypothetical protein FSP39_007220 [Pinctada imbricata]
MNSPADMSTNSKENSLENSRESSPVPNNILEDLDDSQLCQICQEKLKQPKILNCLHVFCEECLETAYKEQCEESGPDLPIVCPICKQETKLPEKGIEGLMTEFVTNDMLEVEAAEDVDIECTSCKAKEKAVARCSDCVSFLCSNCVTAHKFMRCFDNHKVISFDEAGKGDGLVIHKSVFCTIHPMENLKYFCNTCQIPICNECTLGDHKQHIYERISEVEEKHKEELKALLKESKKKSEYCNDTHQTLENSLSELQMQRDNAKGLIQETFQSYKAILENRKDELLKELEDIHSCQELAIMDLFQQVGKMSEKLDDGVKYTEMVLEHGTGLHVCQTKKLIVNQLISLLNNTPKTDINVNIEFHSNTEVFKEAVARTFGSFVKDEPKLERPLSSLHSSFENEAFPMPSGVISPDNMTMLPAADGDFVQQFRTITPVSMTSTMQPPIGTKSNVPSKIILPGSITGGTQVLQEGTCLSRSSHSPAMSDSGISVDNTSNNSGSSASMSMNVAALAKLGFPPQVSNMPPSSNALPPLNTEASIPGGLNPPTPRSATPGGISGLEDPGVEALTRMLSQTHSQSGWGSNSSSIGSIGSIGTIGSNSNMNWNAPPTNSIANNISGGGFSSGNFNTPSSSTGQCPPVRRGNKMSAMQIRCKFGQLGPGKGQFNSPHGFCLGVDEDIVVADTNNHRIQCFEKTGEFKYQFGIPGRDEAQLWYPRKVAVMRGSGKFVVCDRGNERSRMQIFTSKGHFVRKIAIRYIDIVAGLAISSQGHIVAVDSVSPTVFCIAETGDLVKWFDCSDYMREPSDIAISGKEFFVCDFKGHCVVVFNEEGQFMRRIGCENITNYPNGIDISDAGDVLIGDSHGNRFHVAVFQRDGSLIGEFECPYVKVSRCCGLKITSEGYVVTLAKNNHHVLVLNTLYIT